MENVEELPGETPDDVATLYSWANLRGARYRDFSASRREYRAQVRQRAAEELRRAELAAKLRAEAAAEEERMAGDAERVARAAARSNSEAERDNPMRTGEAAPQRPRSGEDTDAALRAQQRETPGTQGSAQGGATRLSYSDVRRRFLARPDASGAQAVDASTAVRNQAAPPERSASDRAVAERKSEVQGGVPAHSPLAQAARAASPGTPMLNRRMDPEARIRFRDEQEARRISGERAPAPASEAAPPARNIRLEDSSSMARTYSPTGFSAQPGHPVRHPADSAAASGPSEQPGPAWLYASNPGVPSRAEARPAQEIAEPAQGSRWFALQGAQDAGRAASADARVEVRSAVQTPSLAVFSLAGGVGKTTLVATLARALSSFGEKVLVAETTAHGLLPFHFGANELRPGVVRTFAPPTGGADAPIQLVSYDAERIGGDPSRQDALAEEMLRSARGAQRLLVDMNAGSQWMLRRLGRTSPTVLVPLAADMNSVISLQTVEQCFADVAGRDGAAVLPYYVMNQFDASLPLHQDVREVLRRQLGERLLPFTVRRAPVVGEALAEGMTVLDYAQEAAVAEDYMRLCAWLRSLAAPAAQGFRKARWSER